MGAGVGAEALQRAANESSCCLSRCVHLGFVTWAPRETTEPEPQHRAGQGSTPSVGSKDGLSKAASLTGRAPPAAGTEDAQQRVGVGGRRPSKAR